MISPIYLKLSDTARGSRLDRTLAELLPQYSRSRIQQWIKTGFVTVNNHPTQSKVIMSGNESIVILPQVTLIEKEICPEFIELEIIYEDESILIINKPPGLVVHPAIGNWCGTLLNGLLYYCPKLIQVPRGGIVHRLDKDTSGLMVIAKTFTAYTNLVQQLKTRSIKRFYLALVWGMPQLYGTINAAISRHRWNRIKMTVSDCIHAKFAVTHFSRLAIGVLNDRVVSLINCQLETGRTHQIRVHMNFSGYALVGDPLYGSKIHLLSFFKRQALHACKLGLIHPINNKPYEWKSNLPNDFINLLDCAYIDIINT